MYTNEDLRRLYKSLKQGECRDVMPFQFSVKTLSQVIPNGTGDAVASGDYRRLYAGMFSYRFQAPLDYFADSQTLFALHLNAPAQPNVSGSENQIFRLFTSQIVTLFESGIPASTFTDNDTSQIDVSAFANSYLRTKLYADPVPSGSVGGTAASCVDISGCVYLIFDSYSLDVTGTDPIANKYLTIQFCGHQMTN